MGCGTGLCGELFKSAAASITGVDIADQMLAVAKQKNIYDTLIEADILDYLIKQHEAYDLILAGDVLVYFGDLNGIFSAAHQALRANSDVSTDVFKPAAC